MFKVAILEILQEQKEVVSDLLTEIIENVALSMAIKEGETTENVSREAIFKLLDSQR